MAIDRRRRAARARRTSTGVLLLAALLAGGCSTSNSDTGQPLPGSSSADQATVAPSEGDDPPDDDVGRTGSEPLPLSQRPDPPPVPPTGGDEESGFGGSETDGTSTAVRSDELRLEPLTTIMGDISPKSVAASGTGVFTAQNMMYRHTITVYDDAHELVATIPDRVLLEDFGIDGPGEPVRGAPVEAAFTPDGAAVYVTNYSMYGPGFHRAGSDSCSPADGIDESFVYRIDVESLEIDQVIGVGAVPKVVAVTPDGGQVLVANWCSYDLSVIDVTAAEEIERIPLGRYPRGIAIDEAGETAYVAVMGSSDIAVVDLVAVGSGEQELDWIRDVGRGPRDLVLGPDGDFLYATLNQEGVVARIDLTGEQQIATVRTGGAPRSMDIAPDGRSLYVVNYHSDTVSKVATETMEVVQQIEVAEKPIGIVYDHRARQVWVACYSGVIEVFEEVSA